LAGVRRGALQLHAPRKAARPARGLVRSVTRRHGAGSHSSHCDGSHRTAVHDHKGTGHARRSDVWWRIRLVPFAVCPCGAVCVSPRTKSLCVPIRLVVLRIHARHVFRFRHRRNRSGRAR
jgi:hypothetical protein